MSELVKQAGENDNISVLYVVDENEHFYGAIDLKDLIIARAEDPLAELIVGSYPYVTDREKSATVSSALWTMRSAVCRC